MPKNKNKDGKKMKKTFGVILGYIIFSIILTAVRPAFATDEIDLLWEKFVSHENDKLLKAAVNYLDEIYEKSVKAQKYSDALKAIFKKAVIDRHMNGSFSHIRTIEKAAETASVELKPLMIIVLAEWYKDHINNIRDNVFSERISSGIPSGDISEWDKNTTMAKVMSLYDEAVKECEKSGDIKISRYYDAIEKGDMPESFRPTLLDFVAHKALDFYYCTQYMDEYSVDEKKKLSYDPALFAEAEEFVKFDAERLYGQEASDSVILKSIKLYQKLLAFHIKNNNEKALIDCDTDRLAFVKNNLKSENIGDIYVKAVKKFIEKYKKNEVCATAYLMLAWHYDDEKNLIEANKYLMEAEKLYEGTFYYEDIGRARSRIFPKYYSISARKVLPSKADNVMALEHKNISRLYFRAVEENYENYQEYTGKRSYPQLDSIEAINSALEKKPVCEWSADLKPGEDMDIKTQEVKMPLLKKGSYRILAGYKKDFSTSENEIKYCLLWISEIDAVVEKLEQNKISGALRHAVTFEPLKSAEVNICYSSSRGERKIKKLTTDEKGYFEFFSSDLDKYDSLNYLQFEHEKYGKYIDFSCKDLQIQNNYKNKYADVVIFTDRALYRPGQEIKCRGVCIDVNQNASSYNVVNNKNVELALSGPDNKFIASQSAVTDKFGSFVVKFQIPENILTGRLMIRDISGRRYDENYYGSNCTVLVEEYKAPSFCMNIENPCGTYIYGEDISVDGKLIAFSGAAVPEARIKYRVFSMPYYWQYACSESDGGFDNSINNFASGDVNCDKSGKFKISFKAAPYFFVHPRVGKVDSEITSYKILIEATDTAGVTVCDNKSVMAGTEALYAVMSSEPWHYADKRQTVNIDIENFNGQKIKCDGTVEVVSLKMPSKVREYVKVEKNTFSGYDYVFSDFERYVSKYEDYFEKAEKGAETNSWEFWSAGETIETVVFKTNDDGSAEIGLNLKCGVYRLAMNAVNAEGKRTRTYLPMMVIDKNSRIFNFKIPYFFAVNKKSAVPGETLEILCATGYKKKFVISADIIKDGKKIKSFEIPPGESQNILKLPVTKEMEGGFSVETHIAGPDFFHRGAAIVEVPLTSNRLDVKFDIEKHQLAFGTVENLALKVFDGSDPMASGEVEFAATLYDRALDSIAPHSWKDFRGRFHIDRCKASRVNSDYPVLFISSGYKAKEKYEDEKYRQYGDFTGETQIGYYKSSIERPFGSGYSRLYQYPDDIKNENIKRYESLTRYAQIPELALKKKFGEKLKGFINFRDLFRTKGLGGKSPLAQNGVNNADLLKIAVRKDFSDSVFFYPKISAKKGETIKLDFKMPEKLTQWRFIGMAHGADMKSGIIDKIFVTSKDLMVRLDPPRFLREGDIVEMPVKIENMTAVSLKGRALLTVLDSDGVTRLDEAFENNLPYKEFSVGPNTAVYMNWKIKTARNVSSLLLRASASTESLSDAVEKPIGVLPEKTKLVESIPIFCRGGAEKKYRFDALKNLFDGTSSSGEAVLTVQIASNPAWYALMSLPVIVEGEPDEVTTAIFERLYAYSIARALLIKYPDIKKTLAKLIENSGPKLEKNQNLKNVKFEETSWAVSAIEEKKRLKSLEKIMDESFLDDKINGCVSKLKDRRGPNGFFVWFPGGSEKLEVTLFICAGFARLKKLGIEIKNGHFLYNQILTLDDHFKKAYDRKILNNGTQEAVIEHIAAYLYIRSFFMDFNKSVTGKKFFNDLIETAEKNWNKTESRPVISLLGAALKRFGRTEIFDKAVAMLKDNSTVDERGMRLSWMNSIGCWFSAGVPVGTHAAMIETFDEAGETECVELCKMWIMSEKQTRAWRNNAVTAEAVYALLAFGENLMNNGSSAEVLLGNETVITDTIEEGTGYFEKIYSGSKIMPGYENITVKKSGAGFLWGGVHLESSRKISKIENYASSDLKIKKTYFIEKRGAKVPVLEEMPKILHTGDKIVVRLEIFASRVFDFVHVKDFRPAGFEPSDKISGYKSSKSVFYYQSNRKEATHFFIDALKSGESIIIEYDLNAAYRGKFDSGPASIESYFAPEFNAHSESRYVEID